jgi:hypothetical protein
MLSGKAPNGAPLAIIFTPPENLAAIAATPVLASDFPTDVEPQRLHLLDARRQINTKDRYGFRGAENDQYSAFLRGVRWCWAR